MCVCVCVCVCACVYLIVFGNSENVQTVYKVRKLVTLFVHTCVKVCLTRFVFTSIILAVNCVHKCVDELHKISYSSYYILTTQQQPEGESISSWGGSPMSFLT